MTEAPHQSASNAATRTIPGDAGESLVHALLRLAPARSVWEAVSAQCPSLAAGFRQHPELAAVDVGFVTFEANCIARNIHGVPNAWFQDAANLLAYVPDVTGSRDLAQVLWSLGSEMQPLAMAADPDPVLPVTIRRQSIILLREFAVVRDMEVLDAAATAWHVEGAGVRALVSGFCDVPATAHGQISLRRRIEAAADTYGRIVSSETGATFEIRGVSVGAPV